MNERPAEPLAIWNQGAVKQQNVRKKNRGEGNGDIHSHEEKSEERREENENEDCPAGPASVVMAGLHRHC